MLLQKRHLIWLSVILLLFALFSSLNSIGLRAEESRRAVTGMEMYKSGNIIVPQIHGCPYYNKPPLFSCILAATFFITGTFQEWAVRLPGILAFLLTGLLSFWVTRKFTDDDTAFLAAMAYLTSADLLFYGSINAGEIDLFYTLITFAQTVSIFIFYQEKKYTTMYIVSYLLAVVGFLTKGMPSIAIQIITISAYLFYLKEWKIYFSRKHLMGVSLFIIIIGGYFYLYSKQNNVIGFIYNLYNESSQRTISDTSFIHSLIKISGFPFKILEIMLPWSLFLIYMIRKDIRTVIRSNSYVLFSVIYVITNIIIYWLSPGFKNRYAYIFIPSLTFILVFFYAKFKQVDLKQKQIIENIWRIIMGLIILGSLSIPFVTPIEQNIRYPFIFSILFTSVFTSLFALYIKHKELRIYVFILFLIISRIGYNIFLMPYYQKETVTNEYMQHATNMAHIAGKETIYYTGDSLNINADVSIFRFTLANTIINTPPLIPYQIPYYLSRHTNKILKYTTKTEKGKLYLVHMRDLKDFHINILYSFQDKWGNDKRMILYRKK